jgi:hypothetical protein
MSDEERTTTADIAGSKHDAAERDVETHGNVTEHVDIADRGHTAQRESTERDGDVTRDDAEARETTTDRDEDRRLTRDTASEEKNGGEPLAPLFDDADTTRFRDRWHELQTAFVDEPREAVSNADELVAELMQQLATRFNQERSALEGQWSRGEDVSTEDLRLSLQRYRSFFERLLAA